MISQQHQQKPLKAIFVYIVLLETTFKGGKVQKRLIIIRKKCIMFIGKIAILSGVFVHFLPYIFFCIIMIQRWNYMTNDHG